MAAAALPAAAAAGPVGWAILGFAAVVVIGVAIYERSRSNTRTRESVDTAKDDATTTTCPKQEPKWRVVVHGQGTDIGGTAAATVGAPPIVQGSPVTAAQGIVLANMTFALLTARQKDNREVALAKMIKFIGSCPPYGFLGQKSFYGLSRDNNRLDVDSYGPSPNFVS